jgi:hypothetical protein
MSALRYGYARHTWAGCHRDEIPSREYGPYTKPAPFIGMCKIILPGFDLDWVLHQDMRDQRRFAALDLDGVLQRHATPRELAGHLKTILPSYGGRRHCGDYPLDTLA